MASTRTRGTSLLALGLAAWLAPGCAWWGQPDPPALDRLELEGEARTDEEGHLEGDLEARTTLRGALVGAGSGAFTGCAVGVGATLITCTPSALFYPLCVAVGVVVLGGGGLVIGGVGGSVVGGVGGLPTTTAEEVNAILLDLQVRRSFPEEFLLAIRDAVPSERQLATCIARETAGVEGDPPPVSAIQPDAMVIARLDQVKLRQHYSERLSLRMWSSMDIAWNLASPEPDHRVCEYEWTSDVADVEDWVLAEGELFDLAFTEGLQAMAGWMARDLDAFASRTEFDATDDAPASCYRE